MNQALWDRHLEIVQLRQRIRELEHASKQQRLTRCVYCGTPTKSLLRACAAHRDLPALDPGYHHLRSRP